MSRTSKITALYERLSRDDDLNGESNSIMCFITPTSLSYRRNFGTAFRSERNERTELRQEERTATD